MNLKNLTIITGMSGSGKHTLLKSFEDMGYFCVDNLPIQIVADLVSIASSQGGNFTHLAVVVDIRVRALLKDFDAIFESLRKNPFPVRLLFLEASDATLVKRFSETRRPHPLAREKSILEGIRLERKQLSTLKALADQVIDTSDFTAHMARRYVADHFRNAGTGGTMITSIVSFGFKYGIPMNSDLVFDVRFLPNPFFLKELKKKTGHDKAVIDFLRRCPDTEGITKRIRALIAYLHPRFLKEGKSYLTVSIGCTGGRHRSVAIANMVTALLRKKDLTINLIHRDLGKDL